MAIATSTLTFNNSYKYNLDFNYRHYHEGLFSHILDKYTIFLFFKYSIIF